MESSTTSNSSRDSLVGVIAVLYKWRKYIVRIMLLSLVVAIIGVFFLKNYYKSTTIFYAASSDLFKPEQINGTSQKDMDYYGNEADIDRLLTIAYSDELLSFLVKKFDLYRHYDIDSDKIQAPFKVKEALLDLYKVEKTKFDAIELSVEDTDPKIAAEMANAAREKMDEMAQRGIKESQFVLIKTYEKSIPEKERILELTADSLTRTRQRYGVYDPSVQNEIVTMSANEAQTNFIRNQAKLAELKKIPDVIPDSIKMLQGSVKGFEAELQKTDENLNRYNKGITTVEIISQRMYRNRDILNRDRERYLQLSIAYNAQISALHLFEAARVPVVKYRPQRTLIVISIVFAVVVLTISGVLLFDNYRRINWHALLNQESNQ